MALILTTNNKELRLHTSRIQRTNRKKPASLTKQSKS